MKTSSSSFHNSLGEFFVEIDYTTSRSDQDLWLRKSDKYDGYDYIATHVGDIIIAAKNPYKFINEIEKTFQVHNITDSPDYYLRNELVNWKIRYMCPQISMSRKYFKGISKNMGISRWR